jgi:hypothetical protein
MSTDLVSASYRIRPQAIRANLGIVGIDPETNLAWIASGHHVLDIG